MEEIFQFKEYGKFGVQELLCFTAEDRRWFLKRIERHMREKNDTNPNQPD